MKYIFLFCIILFVNCNKKNANLDACYGDLSLSKLYYKTNCLSCGNSYYLYVDKKTNWLLIENKSKNVTTKAKYKLYLSEKDEIFMDVFDSNDQKFDGKYLIEFDTIFASPQRDEIKITIQSNAIYMESYKNIVKKIG